MRSFAAITLLANLVSTVYSQASNGCDENYSGTFEINPYNVTASIPQQAQTICNTNPIVTLKDGVLTDQENRTGEVVANHQFQFDSPVQGPITSGFSVCSNGSLALNGNAIWYGCNSGSFSNLYSQSIASYCVEVYIVTFPCVGSGTGPIAGGSDSSSSSSTTSSSTSTSSTPLPPPATSSTSTTPVVVPPPVTSSTSTTPVSVPPPATSATVTSVPFPAGNTTAPASTASSVPTTSIATTSPSSTSSTTTTPATTFKGAASIVAVGGKVVAVVAGVAAFALV